MTILFFHGVPDTSHVWQPLIKALALGPGTYSAPDMPGFGTPLPEGFSATKEAYLDWLVAQLEELNQRNGPVDLIGHDWGAILAVRAATRRPDLIRSWTACNAVPERDYRWHVNARIWQTPLLGELSMALSTPGLLKSRLVRAGMPADIAAHETQHINGDMKRAILALYRSAQDVSTQWGSDFDGLHTRGLVVWGDEDPFMTIALARRFCETTQIPLHIEAGAGHWSIAERAETIAARLKPVFAGEN